MVMPIAKNISVLKTRNNDKFCFSFSSKANSVLLFALIKSLIITGEVTNLKYL